MFALPGAHAAPLREELTRLLQTHPRLRAERHAVGSAVQRVREAFSGFLPKITLSGDIGPERVDTPVRSETDTLYRRKATLSVTQTLFDGRGTPRTHEAARLRVEAARHRLDATRQSLLFEGISAYFNVLRGTAQIAIAKQSEGVIKRQLDLEDERVERGGGIEVDALLAKTRLQLARERTVRFQGQLEQTRARYRQVFGHGPRVGEMADPNLRLGALPDNIEAAAKASAGANPALLASERDARVAERMAAAARADLYPRIELVGQLNREADVDAVSGTRRDWSVLLRASWRLFSGFAVQANVAATAEDKAAARDTYLFNRRKTDQELRIAWQQLATARKPVKLMENASVIAEQVFEARKRPRNAGKETAVNVLDAQTEFFAAQQNSIAARFDSEIAAVRVIFVIGRLTPQTLDLNVPAGIVPTKGSGANRP